MRFMICLVCSILFLSANAMAAAGEEAAQVKNCTGEAFVVRQHRTLPIKQHDRIFAGDLLKTGHDGRLGILFKDNTALSLGPCSELVIDEFLFAPSQGKLSIVTRMLKGTAAYVSGVIVKLSPKAARFETPTATIGIRGTRFLVKVGEREAE